MPEYDELKTMLDEAQQNMVYYYKEYYKTGDIENLHRAKMIENGRNILRDIYLNTNTNGRNRPLQCNAGENERREHFIHSYFN